MLKSVKVPAALEPAFARAEPRVEQLFAGIRRRPDQGTLHVGEDRYVMVRAESLYLTWFDALAQAFGDEAAAEFVYSTAREIGRSDSAAFSTRLGVADPVDRLASGPIHFAHAGWALVEILEDSVPASDDRYFLHYLHPNTFESEVIRSRGHKSDRCACLFSAGYSAGWCSDAFQRELHGREIRCVARGDARCEFVMAPPRMLDAHVRRLAAEGPHEAGREKPGG